MPTLDSSKLSSCTGFTAFFVLAHAFFMAVPSPSMSQVVYGRGPDIRSFAPDVAPIPSYTLQSEVSCPTPTFRVGGFIGAANDWANNDDPYASSNSGLGNYGITAGFSLPLGRKLSDFCKQFALQRTLFEQQRVKNMTLNSQYSLFQYCRVLVDSGLGREGRVVRGADLFDDPAFAEGGPLSSFMSCKPLYALLRNRNPIRVFPDEPKDPKQASIKPMFEQPQTVLQLNQPLR